MLICISTFNIFGPHQTKLRGPENVIAETQSTWEWLYCELISCQNFINQLAFYGFENAKNSVFPKMVEVQHLCSLEDSNITTFIYYFSIFYNIMKIEIVF